MERLNEKESLIKNTWFMSLLSSQIKYREYIIPAPNVEWYKYDIYADISHWDGSVKKLFVYILNRDGEDYEQEINNDNLWRIQEQTKYIHYLFKSGIRESEIQTIKSDSFIDKIATYRFYKYEIEASYKTGISFRLDESYEINKRLGCLYVGLKLWEFYNKDKRPFGVGSNNDWFFRLSASEMPVTDSVFSWAKKYISSDNHYSEWKSRFGYFDKNGYGRTFKDGGFI